MIKKQSLIVLITLCASFMGFGQATLPINRTIWNSTPTGWTDTPLDSYLTTFACSGSNGAKFDTNNDRKIVFFTGIPDELTFVTKSNSSTSSNLLVEESSDGTNYTTVVNLNGSANLPTTCTTKGPYTLISTSRYVRWTFTKGSSNLTMDDVTITKASTDDVVFCSVDFPETGNIVDGGNFTVYAQAYEPGVTEAVGQGTGLNAWIGYSLTDASTTADFTSLDWTWVAATFNSQQGINDQFEAEIGSLLSSGTYYYVSRFQLNGGPYTYGGKTPAMLNGGNFWDGTNYVSGVLTIDADQVDFCNVDFPKASNRTTGSTFEVYAQAYEPGVTNSVGQGGGVQAWIGYNTISEDYEPWNTSGWTWVDATYDSDWLNNDQYVAEIGCGLPAGTYYYASRFQLNGSDYSYGGIQFDNVGNFWDLTNNNGTLTVIDPPTANVVITEIMYNSSGTDDEWIEICNVSGSTQDISNYIIDVTGEGTVFTFPCNTTIADGACITIDLGNGGVGVYNDECTFSATYSNSQGTGTLGNDFDTITLKTADGTTTDVVTYDDGDDSSTDNNGSSYHIIDTSLDNSSTSSNWQAVAYGGSPGANTLLPSCLPAGIEINVEGNLGNFPTIPDNDTSPSGLDNTLFAAQFVGASQSKSYRIRSLFSTDIIISNITITGHSTDFTVTSAPASPVTYLTPSILEITFSPTVPGTRTAVVHIFNNDADESEYTFTIGGDGKCIGVINSITPASGPEGTIVTVSASGIDLNSATASFNGVPATTVNYISATDMLEVTVPNGASDGNLELLDGSGCTGIIAFDVIDTKISSCGGSGSLSDLIISEITDATTGGVTYIEIYNGTGSDVNLNGYSIEIFSNGGTSSNSVVLNNVILLNDNTYIVAIGVSSSPVTTDPGANTCPITGGNGELAHQKSTIGGINKIDNQHDMIRLVNAGSTVDEFGVYQDNDWMDSTIITGNRGFNFRRLNTASPLPNPTFNINDWNVIDWVGQGLTSCSTNDYSDIGVFDFSTGTPPMVASGPTITSSCNTATINVTGTEGSDPAGLAYQWYYNIPGTIGWVEILNTNTDYTGQQGALLTALDTSLLEGYQYYCQIREDDADCYTASDAVQLTLPTTTWDGSSWNNGAPLIDTIAIIDGDYDTGITGDLVACNLIINSGYELNVRDNTYVKIQNNVVVDGTIIVQTHGAFVQVDDAGTFTLNPSGNSFVNKTTAKLNNWYEYTYWSSPVIGETVEDAFPDTPSNRRFWFNAQNYKDSTKEVGNNNQTVSDQDDIDDAAPWDWQIASGVMQPGIGYAATYILFAPYPNVFGTAEFVGPFNTRDVTVSIYRNDSEPNDNNWNLIGNPYPSAINADSFLINNLAIDQNVPYKPAKAGFIEGAIFFWSQNSEPLTTNNGNQNKNFSQNDYAIITMAAEVAGGDGVKPNRFIPSGQAFFIAFDDDAIGTEISPGSQIKEGTVKFTNSMRMADGTSNSQFFRTKGGSSNKSKKLDNKLWVNLTSDNGVFNQMAVGYVDYATNAYDGMGYDTPRNLSNPLYSSIYTLISGYDKKFAIQGKDPNSLNLDEVIPLGFDTTINEATVYTLSVENVEGDFLTSNTIFLKDNLLNKVHDLTASDYSFTSEVGEFKDRFEIVFQSESLSDIEAQLNINKLTIIELNDGRVQLKTNSIHSIKSVQILDLLGRTLYQLNGTNSTEIYNLNTLSQAAYIAKVELSNGQIITKKAIKRN